MHLKLMPDNPMEKLYSIIDCTRYSFLTKYDLKRKRFILILIDTLNGGGYTHAVMGGDLNVVIDNMHNQLLEMYAAMEDMYTPSIRAMGNPFLSNAHRTKELW